MNSAQDYSYTNNSSFLLNSQNTNNKFIKPLQNDEEEIEGEKIASKDDELEEMLSNNPED